MAKKKTKFICQECGYQSPKYMGRCPGCGQWNTLVEEMEPVVSSRRLNYANAIQTEVTKPRRTYRGRSWYWEIDIVIANIITTSRSFL